MEFATAGGNFHPMFLPPKPMSMGEWGGVEGGNADFGGGKIRSILLPAIMNSTTALQNYDSQNFLCSMVHIARASYWEVQSE